MKLVLKNVRLAFPELWEPKQFGATGEAACSGMFLMEPGSEQFKATVQAIQQVAQEKWKDKAGEMLKTLKAKGDLCLHDGATKSEYTGFDGKFFVSARNKARPTVVAKQRYMSKPVAIDAQGNTFIDGKRADVPFKVTVPYSGCRVNVSLDVWAQENQYGKRVNAKLLAVQFEADDEAFSGGEGFAESDFDETSTDGGGDNFEFGGGDDDGFFGGGASKPAADDGFFGGGSGTGIKDDDIPF